MALLKAIIISKSNNKKSKYSSIKMWHNLLTYIIYINKDSIKLDIPR